MPARLSRELQLRTQGVVAAGRLGPIDDVCFITWALNPEAPVPKTGMGMMRLSTGAFRASVWRPVSTLQNKETLLKQKSGSTC